MGLELLLPLMIVVLVVLMIMQNAKQRKALKALRTMQASLTAGDRVLTTSGLHGKVVSTAGESLILEIAPGVETEWDRRVIREKFDDGVGADDAPEADESGSR